jgi:hypothetical protein
LQTQWKEKITRYSRNSGGERKCVREQAQMRRARKGKLE